MFNSKIPESKDASIIDHIASGCGVALLVGVCKDAVSCLARLCGQTSKVIHLDIHIDGSTPDSYFVKGMSRGIRKAHEAVVPEFSEFLKN